MILISWSLILAVLLTVSPVARSGDVTLKDGVITYSDGTAKRSVIQVGGPCSDLWVSPDGRAIAFIRIDKSEPDPNATDPFIERSTIFVASRSNGFRPIRVALDPPRIDGREWNVFFEPVLSPDLKTVYFQVPAAGNSWLLMIVPIAGGTAKPITWQSGNCVLWGGAGSGDVIAATRSLGATDGMTFRYYRYRASGPAQLIGTREGRDDWEGVVRAWTHKNGGTCEEAGEGPAITR